MEEVEDSSVGEGCLSLEATLVMVGEGGFRVVFWPDGHTSGGDAGEF